MQRVLLELQGKSSWKEAMKRTCRMNKLNIDLVSYFTPLRIRPIYLKFLAVYDKKGVDRSERWLENQLKAFYWMSVAISCITDTLIIEFGEDQWTLLKDIFVSKTKLSLEYEAKKMIEDIYNKSNWEPEQDKILTSIAQSSDSSYKWNDYARRLYEQSNKMYIRTGKQCRERWLNHLDPSKKHGDWTDDEDTQIITLFLSIGKKWSKIAKILGGCRTEHMVKNRYKAILSKQRRQYPSIKVDEKLMRLFLDPSTCVEDSKKQEEKSENVGIKSEEKSHEVEEQNEEQDEQFNMNELVVEQQNKSKNPLLNPSFQVFSPWYVSIPLTPNFSPNVPFFVNFSTTFSSLDSNFSNQFCCVKKQNDDNNS